MNHGVIVSVIDKLGKKKDEHRWGREVFYNRDLINIGSRAMLHYHANDGRVATTLLSVVENIEEDGYGLTLYTENSVYYIKKDIDNN